VSRLLLYPCEIGPLVDLQAFLRDAHEDVRAQRDRDIAERKASGVNVSEHADTVVAQTKAQAAVNAGAAGDEPGMRKALADAAAALGTSPLEPIAPYVVMPEIEGIKVRFRVLSERDRRAALSAVMSAADSDLPVSERAQAVSDARANFVRAAVAEVHGLENMSGPVVIESDNGALKAPDVEALRIAGLHGILYEAAVTFQVLPAKKGVRFGQPAGSALSDTSAPGVLRSVAKSLGVTEGSQTATADPLTSPAHSTNQTPVPVAN